MKLAISNIAWNISEDAEVSRILVNQGVNAIEVALTKYFPDLKKATKADVQLLKLTWADRGIDIIGMQSLFFGTSGYNLFGDINVRASMMRHLELVCRLGSALGAKKLVFGSPKNRDRTGLSDFQVEKIATSFFRQLGNIAASNGVHICLEPNPKCYNSNFLSTTEETAKMIRLIDHPSIQMQLDTGAIFTNEENINYILERYHKLIGHIHISEPELSTISGEKFDHLNTGQAIRDYLPNKFATIEMLPAKEGNNLIAIKRALKVCIEFY